MRRVGRGKVERRRRGELSGEGGRRGSSFPKKVRGHRWLGWVSVVLLFRLVCEGTGFTIWIWGGLNRV